MDDEEEIITQMGLMLTQLRYARRALEDIERSTAHYTGFGFAGALSEGPSFGAPPLLNGALKVHVVNIRDLTPGTGIGGFLGALLGGVGRFFGGLFGGIVGGTVSSALLPWMILEVRRIVQAVERILDRLGITRGEQPRQSEQRSTGAAASESAGSSGGNLIAQIRAIREIVDAATALFQAASGQPEAAARRSSLPATPQGERWLAILRTVQGVIAGISRAIDGMILLVPLLLGSVVLFIQRLDAVKLAVIEMLQFVMRNVFLLRGVILTTLADTIAVGAHLAGNLLGILGTAVERILSAVFRIVGHLLDGAVAALRFLADGLQQTVHRLLSWLVSSLGAVLTFLGDLRVFRVLVHVIRIIPAVLPPLYELIRGSSPALTPGQQTALERAARLTIPGPSRSGAPGVVVAPPPNLGDTLLPPARVQALTRALTSSASGVTSEMRGIFGTAGGTLFRLGDELSRAAEQETTTASERLQANLRTVEARSADLAQALSDAQAAARQRPETGLEAIARAYEAWLGGGGLDALLRRITEHFQRTPPAEAGTLPRRIVGDAAARPRATVEIQDVVLEVSPPPDTAGGTADTETGAAVSTRQERLIGVCRILSELHDLQERGFRLDPDALYELCVLDEPDITTA